MDSVHPDLPGNDDSSSSEPGPSFFSPVILPPSQEFPSTPSASQDVLPPEKYILSPEEDAFALYLSMGSTAIEAYQFAFHTRPDTRFTLFSLAQSPQIRTRVAELNNTAAQTISISKFSHLNKLAEIRDAALGWEDAGVAYKCEKARGEVAGFYTAPTAPTHMTQINVGENGHVDVRLKSILLGDSK